MAISYAEARLRWGPSMQGAYLAAELNTWHGRAAALLCYEDVLLHQTGFSKAALNLLELQFSFTPFFPPCTVFTSGGIHLLQPGPHHVVAYSCSRISLVPTAQCNVISQTGNCRMEQEVCTGAETWTSSSYNSTKCCVTFCAHCQVPEITGSLQLSVALWYLHLFHPFLQHLWTTWHMEDNSILEDNCRCMQLFSLKRRRLQLGS